MSKYSDIHNAATAFSQVIEMATGRCAIVAWSTINEDGNVVTGRCASPASAQEKPAVVDLMILDMVHHITEPGDIEITDGE